MSTHYSPRLHISGARENPFPKSRSLATHHVDCAGDTGTSHMYETRVSVVQCEWCPENFIAATLTEALAMFRVHEDEMIHLSFEEHKTENAEAFRARKQK